MSFYKGAPPRRKKQPGREPAFWLTQEFKKLAAAIPALKPQEAPVNIEIPIDEVKKRGLPELKAWKLSVRKWLAENTKEPHFYVVKSYISENDAYTVTVSYQPVIGKRT